MRSHQPPVLDRRVQRTQRRLQDGLRDLLRQKPFDELGVGDIAAAADVNRATFYDHYKDKFDLFNALIAADFRELLERRQVCFEGGCEGGLATVVLATGDFLERIHKDKPDCTLPQQSSGPLFDAAVTLAIREVILNGVTQESLATQVPREVFASMISGAIYGAVKQLLLQSDWHAEEPALLTLVSQIHPLIHHNLAAKSSHA